MRTIPTIFFMLFLASTAVAQESTSRPSLVALNEEVKALYRRSEFAIVHVQLPVQRDPAAAIQWEQWNLNADVRKQLEVSLRNPPPGGFRVQIEPTTQPGPHLIVISPRTFTPNSLGLIVDDQGHIAVPYFVPREGVDDPIAVTLGSTKPVAAKYVAADRLSGLTVLQLDTPAGKPLDWAKSDPEPGDLAVVYSFEPAWTRLAVWTGDSSDLSVMVAIDGTVAGFGRHGQVVPASVCKNVVSQLIAKGKVSRAFLGVRIDSLAPNDPDRQLYAAQLGDADALRVVEVIDHSPAQQTGIQPGDLITRLADHPVTNPIAFALTVGDQRGPTTLEILRAGQRLTVNVDLHAGDGAH